MFKFLRRVFIILILLIIVFFIFRLVKPEATSRFVDKVKAIPTTISGRFHRSKKPELIINWETTSTNSNFEIIGNDDYDNEYYDEDYTSITIDDNDEENKENNIEETNNQNNWEVEDLSRLEELNQELDKILASGDNQSGKEETNTENNWNLWEIISELVNDDTWNVLPSWFVVIDVEQPYEPEPQDSTNTTNNNTQTSNTQSNNTPKKTNNTTSTRQQWDCWKWLSVQDCEEMYDIFWNINID